MMLRYGWDSEREGGGHTIIYFKGLQTTSINVMNVIQSGNAPGAMTGADIPVTGGHGIPLVSLGWLCGQRLPSASESPKNGPAVSSDWFHRRGWSFTCKRWYVIYIYNIYMQAYYVKCHFLHFTGWISLDKGAVRWIFQVIQYWSPLGRVAKHHHNYEAPIQLSTPWQCGFPEWLLNIEIHHCHSNLICVYTYMHIRYVLYIYRGIYQHISPYTVLSPYIYIYHLMLLRVFSWFLSKRLVHKFDYRWMGWWTISFSFGCW